MDFTVKTPVDSVEAYVHRKSRVTYDCMEEDKAMPLLHYLSAGRVCFLQGDTPTRAIEELGRLVCRDRADLPCRKVLDSALTRERDVGTRVGPKLAIPHARLPNVGSPIIAAGLSRTGIIWGGTPDSRVHLVVLVVTDESNPPEMLTVLATLARVLGDEQAVRRILSARTTEDLYRFLTEPSAFDETAATARMRADTEALYLRARALAEDVEAGCLLMMSEYCGDLSFVARNPPGCRSVLITSPRRQLDAPGVPFEHVLEIPMHGLVQRHALDLAMLMAVSRELVTPDDNVVCVFASTDRQRLDTISLLNVRRDLRMPLSLHDELESGVVDFQVLLRVLALATELSHEGREGKPMGTLFVLGDYNAVREQCHQLVINPFKGYADGEKNILDPSLAETVKEFASLDGAFIVRGDGVITSAGTYIRSDVIGDSLEGGLGARHAAGQAITARTDALSVVLSESTGTITLFKDGSRVLTLKRGEG
jgi:DNA integrity scanning protein DisA with diadenylate cyclase activity/mannitol/fructose-specific phosphotransferase system IIA component (Ntr-type)